HVPELKYTVYNTGEGEIGGGLFDPPPGAPRHITNYITVADLEAAARKVPEFGGRVITDRMEVPGMGKFRIVADPDGNSFGLWQPNLPAPSKKAPAAKRTAPKKPAKAAKKRR
ncbi:MAG TPA: VOC family protein, partial [Planctomycetota bacterium]|nr:VOC family protein [Planctomycetota bacterium]